MADADSLEFPTQPYRMYLLAVQLVSMLISILFEMAD